MPAGIFKLVTLIAIIVPADSRYQYRESAATLFYNEDRTIIHVAEYHRLNFAMKMPKFTSLKFSINDDIIHDTIVCQTFGTLEQECIYAKTSWLTERTHINNIMSDYNKEIHQLDIDLSTLRIDTTSKRAILNIGGILSQLFGVASTDS